MIIVDTSVWIEYLNRRRTPETLWLKSSQGIEPIALTTLLLAEILQGIRFEKRFRDAERYFRTMTIFDDLGLKLAVDSARNYRNLRARGITIRSTVDCLIATFCIREGHSLLHRDSDFKGFEDHLGLRVIHPEIL